jgi:glycosyltransferase involved in cell wall biosynthesis
MVNGGLLVKAVDRWCRWTYRAASRIVVLSPGFKAKLGERGVPPEKIEVIYNWSDESHGADEPRDEALAADLGLAGRFNVVFAGTMGKAQALDAVLVAAGKVAARRPGIQFVFVGGGIEAERLRRTARERGLSNVAFLPRRPLSEIGRVLRLADVLLVHLKDDPLFRITIPSKIQSYLFMGRPILAAVLGDAADLVRGAGAGLCCAPEDSDAIAEKAVEFCDMPEARREEMGRSGKEYYLRELSMAVGVGRFEETFCAVAAGR